VTVTARSRRSARRVPTLSRSIWDGPPNPAAFTDLYELTMASVYTTEQLNEPATFEVAVRRLPAGWGYLVVCGIESILEYLERFAFDDATLTYLRSLNMFDDRFVSWLATLRFSGEVWAIAEGEVAFAGEPIVRVTAPLVEAQLVETYVLNALGDEILVATNAARLTTAGRGRPFVDFSPRRNHGVDAALRTARAARIGGAVATSLVAAGHWFGLVPSGTMAHSFVMRFAEERDAFLAFARAFPGDAVILLDTYDTLAAAQTLVELAPILSAEDALPRAVRIDSGDLDGLARRVRAVLDAGGLENVQIFVSGDLDERRIAALVDAGAPVDAFGVGAHLLANEGAWALDVAYKLVEDVSGAKLKLSSGKETLPGRKQVYRVAPPGCDPYDLVALHDEPAAPGRALLEPVMTQGRRCRPPEDLDVEHARCQAALLAMPEGLRAIPASPPAYEVRWSDELAQLRDRLHRIHMRDLS
jgi:nicotinate phosphoribosyltransferase